MRCAPGALPITALLAALALGCGARGPQSSAPQGGELAPGADLGQAVEAPAGEAPADPGAGAPTEESPTMRPDVPPANARLTLDTPLILGGGEGLGDVELTLTSVVAETIEASPEDPESYPAGSGVTVGLRISSDQHQEEAIDFARLSAGYLSKERVLTEGLWIELREVEEAAVARVAFDHLSGRGLEHLAYCAAQVQIGERDDARASAGGAIAAAGGSGGDAVDVLRFAHRLHGLWSVCPVHGHALHEHRAHHIVAAAGVGQQFRKLIGAGRQIP